MAGWLSIGVLVLVALLMIVGLVRYRNHHLNPLTVTLTGLGGGFRAIVLSPLIALLLIVVSIVGLALQFYFSGVATDLNVDLIAALWQLGSAALMTGLYFFFHRAFSKVLTGFDYEREDRRPDITGRTWSIVGLSAAIGATVALLTNGGGALVQITIPTLPPAAQFPVFYAASLAIVLLGAVLALLRPALSYGLTVGDGLRYATQNFFPLFLVVAFFALLPPLFVIGLGVLSALMAGFGGGIEFVARFFLSALFTAYHTLAFEAATVAFVMRADAAASSSADAPVV